MKKEILLATNNQGKVERYRKLVFQFDPEIKLHTLSDLEIDPIEVKEDGTLEENAKKKAQAYFQASKIPVLANDAGFYVEGEGLIKNPKRIALKENESDLEKEEIYNLVLEYWKGIARKYGGKVDAAWVDAFALSTPEGELYKEKARREVVLTDKVFGDVHLQFPVRALYISKTTNKPSSLHTPDEEMLEVAPIGQALEKIVKKLNF